MSAVAGPQMTACRAAATLAGGHIERLHTVHCGRRLPPPVVRRRASCSFRVLGKSSKFLQSSKRKCLTGDWSARRFLPVSTRPSIALKASTQAPECSYDPNSHGCYQKLRTTANQGSSQQKGYLVNLIKCIARSLGVLAAGATVLAAFSALSPGRALATAAAGATAGAGSVDGAGGFVMKGLKGAWPHVMRCLAELGEHGLMLAALLSISAFFSLAETSITTLWPWKVRELAEKEGPDGTFRRLQKDVTRFLTTILIGSTVANIAATALVTESATSLFGEAGVGWATGVMTVVVLLLTEIAPKSIAVHNATAVAKVVVRPVGWISNFLYPVGRFCTWLSLQLLNLLGLKSSGEPLVSEQELKLVLSGAEMSGTIEEEEQDMIENVLELEDTPVREVMTPLVDVVAIEAEASLMDLRNLWIRHQYSRVPVFEKRVDNVVGIVYAMDMLDYVEEQDLLEKLTVGRIAHRPAYFVPDSMTVWNLLREFRIRKVHMAIVVNEYGGTAGVVTLEDVVEEIVGEIYDENDSREEIRRRAGYVVQRADGVYDVDAKTTIEDLEEAMEVIIPEGQYETVSGWVCEAFGSIPRSGDHVTVSLKLRPSDDDEHSTNDKEHKDHHHDSGIHKFLLTALSGNARKVGSVRIERIDPPPSGIALGQNQGLLGGLLSNFKAGEGAGEREAPRRVDSALEGEIEGGDESESKSGEVSLDPNTAQAGAVSLGEGGVSSVVMDILEEGDAELAEEVDGGNGVASLEGVELGGEMDDATVMPMSQLSEKVWEKEREVARRRQRRRQESLAAAAELAKVEMEWGRFGKSASSKEEGTPVTDGVKCE